MQNERFTFDIDSENAIVGCTLERWLGLGLGFVHISAFQLPKTYRDNQLEWLTWKIHLAAPDSPPLVPFFKLPGPNPNAKSSSSARRDAARRARAPAYRLANSESVSCTETTSLYLVTVLQACKTPLASENSHFFMWLFTKMDASQAVVGGWESGK